MSTRIGFIGLGIMGGPMAANLVKAGFEVTGYNRSPAKTEQLAAAGGRGAKDIAEAVREADVVATMVPDSPDVRQVLAGEGGVFENAPSGALIIDFSSIRPDVAAALAAEGAERGFRMLDAPVSGGEAGAIEGVLSIMVGGAAEDFDGRRAGVRRGGQDRRARRARGLGSDGQGREPAHGGRVTWSCWPKPSCSSRPTASTPRRRCGCLAAGWPAAP